MIVALADLAFWTWGRPGPEELVVFTFMVLMVTQLPMYIGDRRTRGVRNAVPVSGADGAAASKNGKSLSQADIDNHALDTFATIPRLIGALIGGIVFGYFIVYPSNSPALLLIARAGFLICFGFVFVTVTSTVAYFRFDRAGLPIPGTTPGSMWVSQNGLFRRFVIRRYIR